MEKDDILNLLKSNFKALDAGSTYLRTYSEVSRGGLFTDQVDNRASKSWPKGQYVVTTTERQANHTVADCVDRWKIVAGAYANQFLLIQNSDDGNWYMYDSAGNLLAANEDIMGIISPNPVASAPVELTPTIMYGPPGTGKTFRLQNDYVSLFAPENVVFTTFHQSFAYEDFVEGLKPVLDEADGDDVRYVIEHGVFHRICDVAARLAGYHSLDDAVRDDKESRKNVFDEAIADNKIALLCIDEINRGNVAAIFGDLISLIEPSKRLGGGDELILTLPYSKMPFGVPANLAIVGTMNTADRSIQLLDSALRRRFRFVELLPDYGAIAHELSRDVLRAINKRIRAILGKDAQLGHSHFIGIDSSVGALRVIADRLVPQLEEYFYNDVDKVRFVLNDDSDGTPLYVADEETREAFDAYVTRSDIDAESREFYVFGRSAIDNVILNADEAAATDYLRRIIG